DDSRGVGFGQRSTEHGEVLREHIYQPAVHPTVAGNHPIAVDGVRSVLHASCSDKPVDLNQASLVQQDLQPLPGGELPFRMLRLEPCLPSTEFRLGTAALQKREIIGHRHGDKLAGATGTMKGAERAGAMQPRTMVLPLRSLTRRYGPARR